MANLLVLTGPKKGHRLPLGGNKITVGRDQSRDICLDGALLGGDSRDSVSRRHAVITRVGDDFFIQDGDGQGTPSRNKTLLNGAPVPHAAPVPLRHGDRISICGFQCTFHGDVDDDSSSVSVAVSHESSAALLEDQPADKLRSLLEISLGLRAALEVAAVGHRVIDGLFKIFRQADRGFIVLRGDDGVVALHTLKTRQPADEADARYSSSIVRRCMEKGEAVLGDNLSDQFPDSASAEDMLSRSLMCAPLCVEDGKALGAIQIDTRSRSARFTEDDLPLLLGVANLASVALNNARLHRHLLDMQARERDLELAREVVRGLLPAGLPRVPGYEFHAHYQAAQQVGGDYYDFVELPGGRLAVLLGDVAGKGVAAALIMARFGVEARLCLEAEPSLAAAVTRLNGLLSRARLAGRFVTLAAAVLDPAAHSAAVVNAGHPSPLVCRHASGDVEEAAPLASSGPPLAVDPVVTYEASEVLLLPGDTLVMFSDGVSDAKDAMGRAFRTRGIRGVLQGARAGPREAGERLLAAATGHAAGCPQFDDITLVCFGRVAAAEQ